MSSSDSRVPSEAADRNIELEEQLWHDPDWTCPKCGFVNLAIRDRCRNFECDFDWNRAGEFAIYEVAFLEVVAP